MNKRKTAKQSSKNRSKTQENKENVNSKKAKKHHKELTSPFKTRILFVVLFPICIGASVYYWKNFTKISESSVSEKSPSNQTLEKNGNVKESPTKVNSNGKDVFSKSASSPEFQIHVQDKIVPLPVLSQSGAIAQNWKEIKPTTKIKGSSVKVYVMDNFLSSRECEGLMNAHENHVIHHRKHDPIVCFSDEVTMKSYLRLANVPWSKTTSKKDFSRGTRCINESLSSQLEGKLPWSYSTSFYPGESKFSTAYAERVEKYTGLSALNGGKFQVTSYEKDVGYKIHTDCTEGNKDLRDRYATILIYLQDVPEGGETEFTELGIKVKPRKGRALLWNNMNAKGQCDLTSYHKACPVLKGKKYILQRWYYYHNFPMLGIRNEPPRHPIRSHELTPRVSCDKFESGSCRWYDEWNYDHLTDLSFA